jgi:lipopolysaccharide assembly LptE-like protein
VKAVVHSVLAVLAALAVGCAGYRVGPVSGQAAGGRSVQVNAFTSKVFEPRVGDAVTASLRKQLQQEGTFRLNTQKEGDIIVSGTIVEYDRSHLSLQPGDTLTPRDYRLQVRAHVTAQERGSGRVLLSRDIIGRTTLRITPDLASAERQAVPLAAEDLARNITALLTEGEW